MASSSRRRETYDVFLSFKGTLRNNFVGHLYQALVQNGICTFRDSEELRKGDQISPVLMKAIEESRIAIIIFSEDYASSHWCLEEVAKIMECNVQKDLSVLPVFYKVEPREVRKGRESYERALAKHESKFGKDSKEVQRWKKALFDAGSLSGWHLNDGDESELIQTIVMEISTHLDQKPLHVAKHPVGIDSRVVELKSMSNLEYDDDVLVVGLWGQGGIGKTTLAKAVYNDIFRQFSNSCFLASVREASKDCKDLVTLQEKLLFEILSLKERLVVSSVDRGINLIQDRLRHKKVLLILDDVDDLRQLNALAGERKWFGSGSRIFVTTRDKHLLAGHVIDLNHVYEVKELDDGAAYELFCKHAFLTHEKLKIKTYPVDSVLNYAKGLPFALEVLGSFLRGRGEDEWESTLAIISTARNRDINDVLKISYDGLGDNEKEIFLDIACFFKGFNIGYITKILESCDFEVAIGLQILIERSLIRIEFGILQMHDLIQLMGMDIVNQECDDPRRHSRLWQYDNVLDILSHDMGACAVKAIVLELPKSTQMNIGPNAFTNMRQLRLLILHNVCDFQGSIYLPNELRWFEWSGCDVMPEFSHSSTKLIGLDMSESSIVVPKQFKVPKLEYLNLRKSKSLAFMPDLSGLPNLKEMNLEHCENLVVAHESIACHDKLQVLNLSGCSELRVFPTVLKSKNLQSLILDYCTKFKRFPDIPLKLEGLKELSLRGTAVKGLPESIENLIFLEKMHLGHCKNLISLPSSIYKLQNIKELGLNGCTSLIRFPKYEGSADSHMKIGLSNLHWLMLRGCNLSEVEFLENLSCFPSLRHLDLSQNNMTSLPTSINKRDQLVILEVMNCHQLQEIYDLPPFLNSLWAAGCESLQKFGHFTSIHDFVRRGSTIAHISTLGKFPGYSITLPGGEMPKWVLPIKERFVSFMTSEDLYEKFVGLALCVVVGNAEKKEDHPFEIVPHVNGERRDCSIQFPYMLDSDHIWLLYTTPSQLWGIVDFGQPVGSYVQLGLTLLGMDVKKWGFKLICKQLGDDLKFFLQENQLMEPALLHEVGHASIGLKTKSSFMYEDSSMETDLHKDLQDCQMSTEKHSQLVSKRNYKLTLPQGTQIPIQPPEVQSLTNSGKQTNARTSSVGDSAAHELEPEPSNDPSTTGSGTALALPSTAMPTTSTAFMPSQVAVEMVDLPSTQSSTAVEESASEASDIEMPDLEAIDEILGVVKPRRERPLPSGSDTLTPGAVDCVRAKWEEFYQLTKEGYSQIASNLSVEDRIKDLLAELSSGEDCFTKTPEFQHDCEEFATLFADGIEVFRQNCNKIDMSTAVEESFNKLEDRLEDGKKILKEQRSSYQAAHDKRDELTAERERLKALLAEVEGQIEHYNIHIRREGRSMKQQLSEVQAKMQERDRQRAEVERHLSIKGKCMEDNETLDERLSTFRRNVKRWLDDVNIA